MTAQDLRLVPIATGCWLASILAIRLTWRDGAAVATVSLVAVVAVAVIQRLGATRWLIAALLVGAVCGASATAARAFGRDAEPVTGLARKHALVTVALVVDSDPHRVGGALGAPTYALDATARSIISGTVQSSVNVDMFVLASNSAWAGLLPGQQVRAFGHLSPPDEGSLSAALLSTAAGPTRIGMAPWAQRVAGGLRGGLQRACHGLPAQVRGLLPGLVDGDISRLDPAVADAFRATGMTHLLAVSGANVAMVLGAVMLAAGWCRAGPRTIAFVCGLALIGFVILVRPSPSVLRAAAAGVLGLVALATGRARAALPALAAGVFVLLVLDPALATDIGFALSVCATAGLLLIAPRWRQSLRACGWPAPLADSMAVAAAAQVACTPLIAGLAGSVSLVAVPANLVAEPAVPAATVLGVGAAVLSAIWPAGAAFVAWLASWPARWLLFVAQRGAAAPYAQLPWTSGVWGALAAAVLIGVGWWALPRSRFGRMAAVVGVLGAVLGITTVNVVHAGWPPVDPVLVACDVGQGDGLVLPTGHGSAVVVDSGIEPPPIDGCLTRLGVRDVPLVVLTHFHADHIGGLLGVLRGRRIGQLLVSPFDEPAEGYAAVVREANGIPMSVPAVGSTYVVGPLRLTVLGPIARVVGTRSDPNNNSLIMRAENDGVSMLMTGDAEVEEQTEVLARFGPNALRADILKQPHHGSAYSSPAFLDAVQARVVVVSVGAGNTYGLPNLPTLRRLASEGARVERTDLDGDIAVSKIGGHLVVAYRGHPLGSRQRGGAVERGIPCCPRGMRGLSA